MAEDEYWTDDEIIEYLAGLGVYRNTRASVRKWRQDHDIKVQPMASAKAVREAAARLPGKGRRGPRSKEQP